MWSAFSTNYTKVNVNSAPASEIAPVLGIADALAESIVTWRKEKGRFGGLEQLRQVPGLDPAQLETRKGRIVF